MKFQTLFIPVHFCIRYRELIYKNKIVFYVNLTFFIGQQIIR